REAKRCLGEKGVLASVRGLLEQKRRPERLAERTANLEESGRRPENTDFRAHVAAEIGVIGIPRREAELEPAHELDPALGGDERQHELAESVRRTTLQGEVGRS